jgi:hypothetical protein
VFAGGVLGSGCSILRGPVQSRALLERHLGLTFALPLPPPLSATNPSVLLDPHPKALSAADLKLVGHISDLIARDLAALGLSPPPAPPSAAGADADADSDLSTTRPVQWVAAPAGAPAGGSGDASCGCSCGGGPVAFAPKLFAGIALVDAAAPGLPILLADATWTKFLSIKAAAPAPGGGRCRRASGHGVELAALLGLNAQLAAQAAAAARALRGFEATACISHHLGGSMHLKVTCVPACSPSSQEQQQQQQQRQQPPGLVQSAPAAQSGLYLASVDFLDASDPALWMPNGGGARRLRVMPECSCPAAAQ